MESTRYTWDIKKGTQIFEQLVVQNEKLVACNEITSCVSIIKLKNLGKYEMQVEFQVEEAVQCWGWERGSIVYRNSLLCSIR